MNSTWFESASHHAFAVKVHEACGDSMTPREAMSIFIEAAYLSTRQGAEKVLNGRISEELESRYMGLVKRVRDPQRLADAFTSLVIALEERPHDFLGSVYQSVGMADKKYRGQCFTPSSICDLMTSITLADAAPSSTRLVFGEPAVGSGATIISARNHLVARGFHPRNWFVFATDIASLPFYMAYVQLSLLGVPGVITLGDALQPKANDVHAVTLTGALFPYLGGPDEKLVKLKRVVTRTIFR